MAETNGAILIKDIVNKVISDLSGGAAKKERISEEEIETRWRGAAGLRAGRRSRPVSLKKGKLVVVVEDSSLLYDLTLRKAAILGALKKGLNSKIQEIQFRIGDTNEGRPEGKNKKTENRKR